MKVRLSQPLTDMNARFLRAKRYLILDRDAKYSYAFRSILVREGIFFGQTSPQRAIWQFMAHYHTERGF
jgi:hypothetical protein